MARTGRPTKYDPSFVQIALDYIDSCGREATELPTLEGLSLVLEVDDETLTIWGSQYPQFSAALKALTSKQKSQLMNDGMYGGKDVNSSMAIFLLKANHGMIETEKRILAGDKENPLLPTPIFGGASTNAK